MQKLLRKIINKEISKILESAGKQDVLYDSTEKITKLIVEFLGEYINKHKEKMSDGETWDFSIPEIPTKDIQEKTLIGKIKTTVEYTNSPINKITGAFKRVKLMDNGFYFVLLEIRININENVESFYNEIEYWLAHELHHAFRSIKTINKESKMRFLNIAKKYTDKDVEKITKNNPEIKYFMEMVYLSLPQEIEARQQETAAQIRNSNANNVNELVEFLLQYQPINDARKMINYSIDNVIKIENKILDEFILVFNNNLKNLGLNNFVKNEKNSFFNFWQERINESGAILRKKILRMVSDKFMLKEGYYFLNLDEELMKEI